MKTPLYLPTIRQRPDEPTPRSRTRTKKDLVMTRILIATIALAGVTGFAAAKEAPILQGNYAANVLAQAADVKSSYVDFSGSRGMGGSVEAPQASVNDQN